MDKSKEFKVCRTRQMESVYHMIIECARYEKERKVLMKIVIEE